MMRVGIYLGLKKTRKVFVNWFGYLMTEDF
jgi:hypothetical protein